MLQETTPEIIQTKQNKVAARTLVLGAVPDDFSPETHLVAGPFCFLGQEEKYPGWDGFSFEPDPFEDTEALKKADRFVYRHYRSFLKENIAQFNRDSGLNFSEIFWRMALNPWLLTITQLVWEKQERVRRLLIKYRDHEITVRLVKDNIEWNFQDDSDFVTRGLVNDLFHEWIFSRIMEHQMPENWSLQWVDRSTMEQASLGRTPGINLKSILKNAIHHTFRGSFWHYGLTKRDMSLFEDILKDKGRFINGPKEDLLETDNFVAFDGSWPENTLELIESTKPESVKNIAGYVEKVKRSYSQNHVCFGTSDQLWYEGTGKKLEYALAKEHGEKIIAIQHGGHDYGSGQIASVLYELELRQDAFITWGWNSMEDFPGNYIPLPSPLLSKKMGQYSRKTENALLVGTMALILQCRFLGMPQPLGWLEYRRNKLGFIASLNDKVQKNFCYRPFLNETGSLRDADYVMSKFPSIRIIRKNFHKELFQCKLLIMDNPITTINIALAANIPTVCFWNRKTVAFSEEAVGYYQCLRDAGILYDSPEAAAQHINTIWDYVGDWWQQENVQQARMKWVNQFARADRRWKEKWAETFNKLGSA